MVRLMINLLFEPALYNFQRQDYQRADAQYQPVAIPAPHRNRERYVALIGLCLLAAHLHLILQPRLSVLIKILLLLLRTKNSFETSVPVGIPLILADGLRLQYREHLDPRSGVMYLEIEVVVGVSLLSYCYGQLVDIFQGLVFFPSIEIPLDQTESVRYVTSIVGTGLATHICNPMYSSRVT
jgi:hypothetical protein